MEDNINYESEEMQEVADLAEDVESEEMQEVADPAEAEEPETENEDIEGRTKADAAFAEQRRRLEELEENSRLLEESNAEMFKALSRYFDGETAEELSINANAYAEQVDPDEYREMHEHEKAHNSLLKENQELQNQLMNIQVEKLMQDGLREVQELDPNIKSLEEMGETFFNYISSGLSTKEAYYATQLLEQREKVQAPDAIGKVFDTKVERDYYTSEELDRLTDAEIKDNWDKVMRSMSRL